MQPLSKHGSSEKDGKMAVTNSGLGENHLAQPQSSGWGTKLVQRGPSLAMALTAETLKMTTESEQ